MKLADATLAILDIEASVVELCCSRTADGRDFYVYLKIPPSKYEQFKSAQAHGEITLSDFGEALCYGEGATPPIAVRIEMEQRFGLCHDLEGYLERERRS